MRKVLVVAVIAMVWFAAGCSSANSGGGPSSSTSTPPLDHAKVLQTYFNAFALDKAEQQQPMLSAAAPDSPAYVFAQHQIDGSYAYENNIGESGISPSPTPVATVPPVATATITGDPAKGYTVAMVYKTGTDTYTDFQYSPAGLIETWTLAPNAPLRPRISAQAATAIHGDVTVSLTTAYQSASGGLQVTYQMVNSGPTSASVILNGFDNADHLPVRFERLTPPRLHSANGTVSRGVVTIEYADPPTSPDLLLKTRAVLTVEFDDKTTANLPLT
ncbi:MAG: hypothetical protein WCP28_10500 [Actinomycetes bacterium]